MHALAMIGTCQKSELLSNCLPFHRGIRDFVSQFF